jgi:hypothetical protein
MATSATPLTWIWIAADEENRDCVMSAVREFGFFSASDDLLREPNAVLRMGVPPLRIEVLQSISGVLFEECWERRVFIKDGELAIPLISLADLKTNKLASGRPKDLVDLEELS